MLPQIIELDVGELEPFHARQLAVARPNCIVRSAQDLNREKLQIALTFGKTIMTYRENLVQLFNFALPSE